MSMRAEIRSPSSPHGHGRFGTGAKRNRSEAEMANGKWPQANRPSLVMAISAITSFTISRRGANRHSKACRWGRDRAGWRRARDDEERPPLERICLSGLSVCVPGAAGSRRAGDRVPELPAHDENPGAGRPAAAVGGAVARHHGRTVSGYGGAARPAPAEEKIPSFGEGMRGTSDRHAAARGVEEKRQMFWMLTGGASCSA